MIMVMLLTIWLSNGDITTKALLSHNLDIATCDADAGNIALAMAGHVIRPEGETDDVTVKSIDHKCVIQQEGKDA